MKLAKIFQKIKEDSKDNIPTQKPADNPIKKVVRKPNDEELPTPPEKEDNELRSNIDQYWKNPADLSHDLSLFLKKTKSADYKLYAILVNHINSVMDNYQVQSKIPDQENH